MGIEIQEPNNPAYWTHTDLYLNSMDMVKTKGNMQVSTNNKSKMFSHVYRTANILTWRAYQDTNRAFTISHEI